MTKKEIKCEHYEGDGFTYWMWDCDLSICEKCEKYLRENILSQIKLENKLILPVKENKTGQKRVTIPKQSKIKKDDYVEVTKHE